MCVTYYVIPLLVKVLCMEKQIHLCAVVTLGPGAANDFLFYVYGTKMHKKQICLRTVVAEGPGAAGECAFCASM